MNEDLIQLPEVLEQVEVLSELLRQGKDEMNFVEFPMTSLSDKPLTGETSLKFEDQIYDDRKKKLITRKRIIEGSKEYGLPTATDDAVILAMIQLTKQKNGFTAREVPFSRFELIQLLQWPNKGQSYDRIAQSLHRLASVTYHFENSWWDKNRKAWTTKIFGIIDNVDLNDSRENDGQGGLFNSRIVWNQTVLDSFQAGYLRTLDFRLAISFKHAISMRIYRFMGKRFHLKPEWTFDLKDFSYEHIGLSRNYEGGTQIARKLRPSIKELEDAAFLEPLPESERFEKKGRNWTIRLVHRPSPLAAMPDTIPASEPEPSHLVTELVNRGVTRAAAMELVHRHPTELVKRQIDYFDWQEKRKPGKIAEPGGYLVNAITTDYAAPPRFKSKADQQRQLEAKRQADRKVSDDRRRQQEQEAADKAERRAINAYREVLTPEQLATLEAAAVNQADAASRQSLEETHERTFRRMLLGSITDGYIRKILQLQTEDA